MCGIVGIFSEVPINDPNRLLKMRETLVHRGPDSAGIWWTPDKRLGLAHRRLAIIELTRRGHQPMRDSSGKNVIVFNGEIYNYIELRRDLEKAGHVFTSNSDTEVLLVSYIEWGKNCLERLEGAFAFAIFDGATRELFLARDRAGEKPLYYRNTGNGLIFASELKALMADADCPRQLDLDSLNYYLTYGYVAGPKTILKDIHKLKPGHAMVYSLEKREFNIWRYWNLPRYHPQPDSSIEYLKQELESILYAAVSKQLFADVPVGILLSGGLDSSLITGIAASLSMKPVKTFTVSFQGHEAFNEGPYAKLVAEYFGTDHTELVAQAASMVSLLPQLARQYDEPIGDHSILPTAMLAKLVGESVTVALSGDGGDELFGGYPHYNFLQKIARFKKYVPGSLRGICALLASHALPVGTKGRNHIIGLQGGMDCSLSSVNVFFDKISRLKLLAPLYRAGYAPLVAPEDMKRSFFDNSLTVLQNATRMDFHTTLVDDYLVKTDRASMLSSLELRSPFLDHHLIEFSFCKIPDRLRATLTERKILLRNLAKKILPPALNINRKGSFVLPLEEWFKGEWGVFITEILIEADPRIFDKKTIVKLLDLQRKGVANTNRLFALAMFELWRREYRVDVL